MRDESRQFFLDKAMESLAGAESEFAHGRYNNCANRCYYGCFQAAIAALLHDGVILTGGHTTWGHDFVQAQFVGQLINRRKVYASGLRDSLARNLILRHTADYTYGNAGDPCCTKGKRLSRSGRNERGGAIMNAERVNDHNPRVVSALSELQAIIRARYPSALFAVSRGEDPEGIYLTVTVDVEDTDVIVDLVIDRLLAIQIEESLPVYVIPVRPIARIAMMHQHLI